MRRPQKTSTLNLLLLLLFLAAYSLIHWHQIFFVPAINYDEVRAGHYAHDIAFQPHYWPFHGSNSYTVIFASYWAAPFFRLLGSGLIPLRLSGFLMVLLGILLSSAALYKIGKKNAARLFPFLVTFWPALFMNHRYSMEANTFHFFCLGLFFWGLAEVTQTQKHSIQNSTQSRHPAPSLKKGYLAIAASSILGILSHPFFLAPTLAVLLIRLTHKPLLRAKERSFLLGLLCFFLIYFAQILWFIPEKEKAIALLVLDTLLLSAVLWHNHFLKLVERMSQSRGLLSYAGKGVQLVGVLLTIVALTFVLTYSSSLWATLTATGLVEQPILILLDAGFWVLFGITVFKLSLHKMSEVVFPPHFLILFSLSAVICALILIQPSARSYELSLLLWAGMVACFLGELPKTAQTCLIVFWVGLGTLQWQFNYLQPVLAGRTLVKPLRFLFVKGVTETYPSAQSFLALLSQNQCQLPSIGAPAVEQWGEAMEFLERGNSLPLPNPHCKF